MVLIPGTGAWCGNTGERAPGKVCALASWACERDYPGTAAALERYTPEQLISFTAQLDPGLEGEDFAGAARRGGPASYPTRHLSVLG